MAKLTDLEYLKLTKFQAFWYNLGRFFCAIPRWLWGLLCAIGKFFVRCGVAIKDEFVDIGTTFAKGNWAVKTSFLIFGFGNFYYGQILRGILFLLFEIAPERSSPFPSTRHLGTPMALAMGARVLSDTTTDFIRARSPSGFSSMDSYR